MPEFIRVRFRDSGTEQTIAKPSAIDDKAFEVLDEAATDSNGRALPPKLGKRKPAATAAKKTSSASKRRGSKKTAASTSRTAEGRTATESTKE